MIHLSHLCEYSFIIVVLNVGRENYLIWGGLELVG